MTTVEEYTRLADVNDDYAEKLLTRIAQAPDVERLLDATADAYSFVASVSGRAHFTGSERLLHRIQETHDRRRAALHVEELARLSRARTGDP